MKIDLNDILIVIGSVLVGTGVFLIYRPAAFIAIGVVVFYFGYKGGK
jgi:hypothetical protein